MQIESTAAFLKMQRDRMRVQAAGYEIHYMLEFTLYPIEGIVKNVGLECENRNCLLNFLSRRVHQLA